MSFRIRAVLLTGLTSLFLAIALLGSRTTPLEASVCDGKPDLLCQETTTCTGILWWKKCSSTYEYTLWKR